MFTYNIEGSIDAQEEIRFNDLDNLAQDLEGQM